MPADRGTLDTCGSIEMTGASFISGRDARRLGTLLAATSALLLSTDSSAQAAIAFVSASTAHTSTSGATTLSLAKPTSVATGQVEIATIARQGVSTITPPGGWTQIADTPVGSLLRETSFWHIAGASEATTTWTLSASTEAAGSIAAYSGVDTTTIVDADGEQTGTSGKTATVPSVTATYAGDLVFGVGSFNNQGSTSRATGTTSRFSDQVATTNGPSILGEDVTQSAAGATATQAISDSSAASAWIGQVLALKAASATGVLSVSTSSTPSFSADLDSGDQAPTYTLALASIASVSPSVGWNETVTSTQFSTGIHTLDTSASTITSAPTAVCNAAHANCTAPTNSVSYPVSVPAGSGPPSAVKFFNAASGTGGGEFTVTPTVTVTVPQNSFAGSYSSTLTLAMVSGP